MRYAWGTWRGVYIKTVISTLKSHQWRRLTMKLMSLCIAPEINVFMTKYYDSMLASGSRIVVVHDTSITETALVRTWVYVDRGATIMLQSRFKCDPSILMTPSIDSL